MNWEQALKNSGDYIGFTIESIPNGQSYGKEGHVPSDHVAVFEYKKAFIRLSSGERNVPKLERVAK